MDGYLCWLHQLSRGRVREFTFRLRAGLIPLGVTCDPRNLNERQRLCHSQQRALPCLGLGQDE